MKYLIFIFLLISSQTVFADKCVDLMQQEEFYKAYDVCLATGNKGDKNSQFALAVMYYQGSGVMADMSQSQKWMRKAALQNHPQAQYNLGIMVANGQGSSADMVEAYAWLKISAENGYSAAADSVKQLAQELSSSEKKQAGEKINSIKKSLK